MPALPLIEPHRFTPFETGSATSVTLPGQHRGTHVDVLRISPGLVLAHSHFSPAIRHDDDIRRPEDQLILAFNLSGRMLLVDPLGTPHEVSGGQGWIIRSAGRRLQRIVEKGEGCSNLVIALTTLRLAPGLKAILDGALPDSAPFRRLRLPVPGQSMLETLLNGRVDHRNHPRCRSIHLERGRNENLRDRGRPDRPLADGWEIAANAGWQRARATSFLTTSMNLGTGTLVPVDWSGKALPIAPETSWGLALSHQGMSGAASSACTAPAATGSTRRTA